MDVTKEMTVVIPVRVDCEERKENLDTVLFSLLKMTDASVIILEADTKRKYFNDFIESTNRVEYHFIEDFNPIFHRTRYLNKLIEMSNTNIVGIWDTDVLFTLEQINNCVREVQNGAAVCYPYDGRFVFLNVEQSKSARSDALAFLNDNSDKNFTSLLGRPSVGGAFVVDKHRYTSAGGENEIFYGWGPEDAERFKRMEILEEPVSRVNGPLFHLNHPRGVNSFHDFGLREKENIKELVRICRMDKETLENDIKNRKQNDLLKSSLNKVRNSIDENPAISVIMPVYNTASYLESSIHSILSQTFQNFELIIIDDASTDDSLKIIERFEDERICLIKNKINAGNYACRNQGLNIAKGKYIAVMDSDDIAMPHRLEAQVNCLEMNEDVLAVGAQFFSDRGLSNKPSDYEVIKVWLMKNNALLHPSLLIRKEVMLKVGGYDEAYTFSSDYDLVCKIALIGKIINLPDVLMNYTIRKDQISMQNHSEQAAFANQVRLKYLSNIGFILSEKEGVAFTKVMTGQQLSVSEVLIYEASIQELLDYNRGIGFFQPEILEFFLQESVEHCRVWNQN